MSHSFDIRVGSTVSYDGCLCTVIEIAGDAVVLVDGAKRTRRVRLVELLRDAMDAFGLPSEEAALTPLALIWADATEAQRDEARTKAAHIREIGEQRRVRGALLVLQPGCRRNGNKKNICL